MGTDNELDAMTDGQAAEYYYRHRDEIEHEPGEPVDIELAALAAVAAATHDEPRDREALARRLASVRRAVDDGEQLVQRPPSRGI